MLGPQRSHCHDKVISGFVDSSEGVGLKGRMSSTTDRYRARILAQRLGRQIRRLRPGQIERWYFHLGASKGISVRLPRHSHSG